MDTQAIQLQFHDAVANGRFDEVAGLLDTFELMVRALSSLSWLSSSKGTEVVLG